MSPSWILFLVASLALIVPLPVCYRSTHRYRSLQELDIERRNQSWWTIWRQVLRFPWHWVEFARGLCAGLGVLLTVDQVGGRFPLYEKYAALAHHLVPVLIAVFGLLAIAILYRQPNRAIATIPFVGGTLLGILPPQVALPALILAGASAFTMGSLGAFFGLLAPALALLGYFLDRQLWPSFAGAALAFMPLLFAFSQGHEFVIAVRRPRTSERPMSPLR